MVASSDKELPQNTFATKALGKLRLNHSAVVYGPNASGKSNLIEAVDFFAEFVRTSAERTPHRAIPVKGFLFDESTKTKPSEFEVTFLLNGVRYEYGFIVDQNRVYEEWLIAYPKGSAQIWFERTYNPELSEDDWYFGRHLKGEKGRLIPLTRPNALFLSIAAQFNHEQLKPLYNWFVTELHVMKAGESLSVLEIVAMNYLNDKPALQREVGELLRHSDLGIVDFSIEEAKNGGKSNMETMKTLVDAPDELSNLLDLVDTLAERDGITQKHVQMYHQVDGHRNTRIPLSIREESFGTRRLFALAAIIINRLNQGGVLLIDELDSSLHPLLVREIIQKFHNRESNPGGGQLIFNTHDTTLLDQTILRRDQIWFTEKGMDGASKLYSLLDFKPRNSEAVSKKYLQGRYGAIPFLEPELEI